MKLVHSGDSGGQGNMRYTNVEKCLVWAMSHLRSIFLRVVLMGWRHGYGQYRVVWVVRHVAIMFVPNSVSELVCE